MYHETVLIKKEESLRKWLWQEAMNNILLLFIYSHTIVWLLKLIHNPTQDQIIKYRVSKNFGRNNGFWARSDQNLIQNQIHNGSVVFLSKLACVARRDFSMTCNTHTWTAHSHFHTMRYQWIVSEAPPQIQGCYTLQTGIFTSYEKFFSLHRNIHFIKKKDFIFSTMILQHVTYELSLDHTVL